MKRILYIILLFIGLFSITSCDPYYYGNDYRCYFCNNYGNWYCNICGYRFCSYHINHYHDSGPYWYARKTNDSLNIDSIIIDSIK